MTLFSAGVWLTALGAAVAVFTSNVVLSKSERELAESYRQLKDEAPRAKEAFTAYVNWVVSVGCRVAVVVGLATALLGFISQQG